MRHRMEGRKLGRTKAHRQAMFANMASSLILHDRLETTLPRAKELRRLADRMVTLGKRGTIAARRRALQLIRSRRAVNKAFDELAPRYADRSGGYTRIMKLGWRHGDAAPMAVIEYLHAEHKVPAHEEKKPKAKKKKEAKKEERAAAREPEKKARARKARPTKERAHKAPAKKRSGRKVTKKED